MSLSPQEIIQMTQQVYSLLLVLTKEEALAGIVLTDTSFDHVKNLFGDAKVPYVPAPGLDLDPEMRDTFVVDGLLVMRGTQLQ